MTQTLLGGNSQQVVNALYGGAGYGRSERVKIAQTYGYLFSSDKYDKNAQAWTEKGWDDATEGKWN
jgi:hypothetical protein